MYVTVYKFKLKSGREEEVKAAASRILESLKGAKGFVSAVIYHDEEANDWGRTTVWETKEDQVAYMESIPSERREETMSLVDGPLEMKRCDVVGYVTAD